MVRAQNLNFPRKSYHCALKLTLWLGILLTSLLERVRRQRARPESRYTLGENTEELPNIYVHLHSVSEYKKQCFFQWTAS